MLRSIFSKSLYERRFSIFIWFAIILFFSFLVVVLFPVFRDSFGASLKDVPESMKNLIGSAADYQTLTGYIDIQVINQMVFMTIIYAVILASGLLGGDESKGTLHTLLALPVRRSQVYLQKAGALLVILACITIPAIVLGCYIGSLFVHESIPMLRLLEASFGAWLVTAFFGILTYSVSSITGSRGIAGGLIGLFAFATYMITSLAATVEGLKTVNYLSPFHYFNSPSIMKHGLDSGNTLFFVATMLLLLVVGLGIFIRRDIYQR